MKTARRGVRPEPLLALAVVILTTAAVSGWILGARHELRQVEAAWTGPPICTGATVTPHRDDAGERDGNWVINAEPGMHCRIEVTVTHHGGRAVRLDALTAPYLGPAAGDVAIATGGLTAPEPRDDGIDATYDLDQVLRGGDTATLAVELTFRKGGCGAAGTFGTGPWPVIAVSLWDRSTEVPADGYLYLRDRTNGRYCVR